MPHIASASRSVTIESGELVRIIQNGITAGLLRNMKGSTDFIPNTLEILSYLLSDRFKHPRIKEYYGTTDLINHLSVYTNIINLQVAKD